MKIVPAIPVTAANLTSNVAITETAWTAGTYTLGTRRYVGTTLYEVVVASTTDEPTAGAAKTTPSWLKVGSINRYKMFDFSIGDATTKTGDIIVTVVPGMVANAVALFELVAQSVRVKVTNPTEGVVYDKTTSLIDNTGITDWYAYFFQPYKLDTEALFADLPSYLNASVEITIANGTSTVAVGEVVLGQSIDLGVTLMNVQLGIEDYSKKERNIFGAFSVVERRFAKTAGFDVFLENNQITKVYNTLAQYRAKPSLYIGDDSKTETILLGFYRDFSIMRSGPITSEMTLEIEGLV